MLWDVGARFSRDLNIHLSHRVGIPIRLIKSYPPIYLTSPEEASSSRTTEEVISEISRNLENIGTNPEKNKKSRLTRRALPETSKLEE